MTSHGTERIEEESRQWRGFGEVGERPMVWEGVEAVRVCFMGLQVTLTPVVLFMRAPLLNSTESIQIS